MTSTLIVGGTIVGPDGLEQADVLIEDGTIVELIKRTNASTVDSEPYHRIDATGLLLFPGLIDCHVHFREPGYEHKATMRSESVSARFGGITTVCEMPNTNPPCTTIAALADKVRRTTALPDADIRFFFGITDAAHLFTLRELWLAGNDELTRLKQRCSGVKLYLDHSTGNQKVPGGIVEDIFRTCAELDIPLVAHCEDPDVNALAARGVAADAPVTMHSIMRPAASESAAIEQAVSFVTRFRTPLHIAHLSSQTGLQRVQQAKKQGLPVTCEVAPHHLFLTDHDYAVLGTRAKMNPPLRTPADRAALWQGIVDGSIDCIATDHAPHTEAEKQASPPLSAPSGVPGVETMLPLLLTVMNGGWPHPTDEKPDVLLRPTDLYRLCFANPNRIFRLGKEPIAAGSRSPVVLVDPHRTWNIVGRALHSQCGWTPFEGWPVQGAVTAVLGHSNQ